MFWYCLFVALMLCSGLEANTLAKTFNRDAVTRKLQSALKDRCLKNADKHAYNELKVTADNYMFCLGRNARTPTSPEDAFRMICNEARHVGYNCTAELFRKVDRCLDPQEKYLPNFFLGGHNRTMDQQCRQGPTIKNILPSLMALECKPASQGMGNIFILGCLPKLRSLKILSDPNYIFTQPNVCGDIKIIKQCVADVVKSHCKNEGPIVKLLTEIIDPLFVPCNATSGK